MDKLSGPSSPNLPLHIARALQTLDGADTEDGGALHRAALLLADALACHMGAVAVAQYSQAVVAGDAQADPTLNRSLRSLRRVLPGQWLGWAARSLEAVPEGTIKGAAEWYLRGYSDEATGAYEGLRAIMVRDLGYEGDYGARPMVPPRILLEMVDQYRIRRNKVLGNESDAELDKRVGEVLAAGLRAIVSSAGFLREYLVYAPATRQVLTGVKATTPMPPMTVPVDLLGAATLLLYPPGAMPDFTKRPTMEDARLPIFPLDPLLVYIQCEACDRYRVAALHEIKDNMLAYRGLDPECGHAILSVYKEA